MFTVLEERLPVARTVGTRVLSLFAAHTSFEGIRLRIRDDKGVA